MTSPATPPLVPLNLTEGIWDLAAVMALVQAVGANQDVPMVPGVIGQAIPDMPDRLCVVTDTSGGPLEVDGLVDTPAFQVRFRGAQGDPLDAQRLALVADRALLFGPRPRSIAAVRILSVQRSGGRPTALLPNPSPGLRGEFTCTYRARVIPAWTP